MDSFLLPEIKRTHLAEVILQVKNLRLGSSKDFLSKVMEPPEEEVIDKSIKVYVGFIIIVIMNSYVTPLMAYRVHFCLN